MDSAAFIAYAALFLTAAVKAGTPLLFATLGETITERSGHLNLGVEGMMLMGAVAGFQLGLTTGSPVAAIAAALLAGALGAGIYAFLTVTLKTNQVVSGLSLTIFGSGIAGFIGQKLGGQVVPASVKSIFVPVKLPLLGDIPVVGQIFFKHDILVYAGYLFAIGLGIYLFHTRKGLNLRAVGENPGAADAAGLNVTLYKYMHILAGGALCGLGGAYLSLVYVPAWQENITAGRGWIAVALVIFITWNPYKAILGAYVFGGLDMLGLYLQKFDIKVSQYLLNMLPYVVTILVLVMTSIKKSKENKPPKSLGEPYFREDR